MRQGDQSSFSLTLVTILSITLFLSSVIVVIYDVSYWLRYASWSITRLSDVFRYNNISEPYFSGWRGVQKMWEYLRDAPLSLLLLVIWFLFSGVAGSIFGTDIQNDHRGGGPGRGKWH